MSVDEWERNDLATSSDCPSSPLVSSQPFLGGTVTHYKVGKQLVTSGIVPCGQQHDIDSNKWTELCELWVGFSIGAWGLWELCFDSNVDFLPLAHCRLEDTKWLEKGLDKQISLWFFIFHLTAMLFKLNPGAVCSELLWWADTPCRTVGLGQASCLCVGWQEGLFVQLYMTNSDLFCCH